MTQPRSEAGALLVAVDVHYLDGARARAAVVAARDRRFSTVAWAEIAMVSGVPEYQPGEFYRRELPPLKAVIPACEELGLIVVDGYVDLDPDGRPGLGAHVQAEFGVPVIGVAKTAFRAATHAAEVLRGQSSRPLYVTAAGMTVADAAALVADMAGQFRLPDALKLVDRLARGLEQPGAYPQRRQIPHVITKVLYTYTIHNLRQEQKLRDHGAILQDRAAMITKDWFLM